MRAITLILASIVVLSFPGCRKFDFPFKDPAKLCNITSMQGELFESGTINRAFHYNEFGNPELVEYVETGGGTGTPNFYFRYNNKNQLIAYEGYSWHNLTYNSKGQVAIDSVRQGYAGGDARFAHRFFYDVYGRVIKEVIHFYYDDHDSEQEGSITTQLYQYDRRGNLIIPGVTYDNKTSIYRTHPLWMFLHRNYSVNNAVRATSYNTAGLPTAYNGDLNFLESSISVNTVNYECEVKNK